MSEETPSRFPDKPLTPSADNSSGRASHSSEKAKDWTGKTQAFLAQSPEPSAPAKPAPLYSDLAETFRHSGWAPFRRRVDEALTTVAGTSPRRISAFRTCGCDARIESRTFGYLGAKEYRIRSTKCHDRFCVPCSQERANRIRTSLLTYMAPKQQLSLITLTLKQTTDPLTMTLDRITRCFRLLRNKPLWNKAVAGGCATIEVKVADDGKAWNVHFHVIAEAKFVPQKELSHAWHNVTGDSYIVDVRRVGAKSGAVQYITKYITKAADHSIVMSPRHLQEAIIGFTSRRLVSTFGTWRGLKLMEKPDEQDEIVNASEWRNEGPLDDFIRRAAKGDADALRIIAPFVRDRRGRPERPPDDDCPV